MAKKSMILKQQAEAKFSTRKYNRCKVCGRPAPKDTEPYNYMKRRLNEFLAAQGKLEEEEEETPELFRYDFIRELNDMYSVLHNNTAFLKGLDGYIDRTLMNNFRIRTRIDALNDNIEKEVEQTEEVRYLVGFYRNSQRGVI